MDLTRQSNFLIVEFLDFDLYHFSKHESSDEAVTRKQTLAIDRMHVLDMLQYSVRARDVYHIPLNSSCVNVVEKLNFLTLYYRHSELFLRLPLKCTTVHLTKGIQRNKFKYYA